MENIIKLGININTIINGVTPLQSTRHFHYLKSLVKYGANINYNGDNAPLTSVWCDLIFMLENGADPNRQFNGVTTLVSALNMEDFNAVVLLLNHGADPDLSLSFLPSALHTPKLVTSLQILANKYNKEVKSKLTTTNFLECYPLHLAAIIGNIELANDILNTNRDWNRKLYVWNLSPLHLAVLANKAEMMKWLVQNSVCKIDQQSFEIAVDKGNIELMEWIAQRFNFKPTLECFRMALRTNRFEVVRKLIELDPGVYLKSGDAFELSVQHGDTDMLKQVMRLGATSTFSSYSNINYSSTQNTGKFCKAATDFSMLEEIMKTPGWKEEILRDLVCYISPEVVDKIDAKSIFKELIAQAAQKNNVELLKATCKQGADVSLILNQEDEDQGVHISARYMSMDVLEELIKMGANVNKKNKAGETPLHALLMLDPIVPISCLARYVHV